MLRLRTSILLLAATTLLVVPAEATITYYSPGGQTEADFNTAVVGLTLLNPALTFSGTPGSTGLLNASGTGIDFLGFDDLNSPLSFTINAGKLIAAGSGEKVTITFPAGGVYAFGIHITVVSSSGSGASS